MPVIETNQIWLYDEVENIDPDELCVYEFTTDTNFVGNYYLTINQGSPNPLEYWSYYQAVVQIDGLHNIHKARV